MSRFSRGTHLIVIAKRAARGASSEDRNAALADMVLARLPPPEVVGEVKHLAARTLREATLNLAALEGEARALAADAVMALVDAFARLENDAPYPHRKAAR
jgi:hypothetical protein